MLKKRVLLFIAVCFLNGFNRLNSQETIKTMFYNLLNFSEAPPTDRADILNNILATYQPDIFMVAELQSPADRDLILNNSFNYTGQNITAAPFVFNTSGFASLNQLVFYDDDKMTLISSTQIQTNIRDINHYKFELSTNQNEILDVFVAHFKAAQGDENVQERLAEANAFINYASNNLTSNSNVIFGGDFNFYTAQEPAFQTILFGTQSLSFLDPINRMGDWNSNFNFKDVHTQSTRLSNNSFDDFGAGGGLDDRFDFIFISDNLTSDSNPIRYAEDSYKAYGNNANCYNDNINFSNCTGTFSQSLRDLLYDMSDHLPVVMNLEIDSNFLASQQFQLNNSVSFLEGNLVSQRLQLQFSDNVIGKKLRIYNQLGQLVKLHTIESNIESLDIESLNNGFFFLQIENLNGALKFLKNQ